jgi:hypothetical protein
MKWRWVKRRNGDQVITVSVFLVRVGSLCTGTLNGQPHTFWHVNITQSRSDLLLSRICNDEKQAKRTARRMLLNHIRKELRIMTAAHTLMVGNP